MLFFRQRFVTWLLAVMFGGSAMLLTACGNDGQKQQPPSQATRLTVTTFANGRTVSSKRTIDCTHYNRQQTGLCQRLRTTPSSSLQSIPGIACTEIYGGPARVTVTGSWAGRPVHLVLQQTNGCQIDLWRKNAWLVGAPSVTNVPLS